MVDCQSRSYQTITWAPCDVITKENWQTKPNKQSSAKTERGRDMEWALDSINTV